MGFLDFIFPKTCIGCSKWGDYICTSCFTEISFDVERMCLICNRAAIDGITHPSCRGKYVIDGSIASIAYKRLAKRLIYAFKYKQYLSDLQQNLSDFFYEGLIQTEQFHKIIQKDCVFVPIPLHPKKLRVRGYNQAEILAKNLGKRFNIPVKNALERVKVTSTQVILKREERRENIRGAFAIKDSQIISTNLQVILVDDVITSGATMLEAANALKRAGIKRVWGIALAHGK